MSDPLTLSRNQESLAAGVLKPEAEVAGTGNTSERPIKNEAGKGENTHETRNSHFRSDPGLGRHLRSSGSSAGSDAGRLPDSRVPSQQLPVQVTA